MSATLDKRTLQVDAALIIARAICAVGAKAGCLCKGNIVHCHAHLLYDDYAVAAVSGLERAGFTFVRKEAKANG